MAMQFEESTGMIARGLSGLGNYEFEVIHRKGALHINADALSRKAPRKCKTEDCETCALNNEDCICDVVTEQQVEKLESSKEKIGSSHLTTERIENSS